MTYYSLRDNYTGEVMEMLCFKNEVDGEEVQESINKYKNDYFYKTENKIDTDACCEYEYILNQICDNYDVDIVPWSNDDNLYF